MLRFRFERPATHVSPRPVSAVFSFALFGLLLAAYATSPVITSYNSRWSVHTAMSFLLGHGGDLTKYLPIIKKENFYSIEYPDGRPRTRYPIGTALLATPFVAVSALLRPHFAEICAPAFRSGPNSSLPALSARPPVSYFFVMLFQFESVAIALASTFIFAFGTSIWSTATRALWQHGPLVLMLVIAMLLLVRARRRPELIQYLSLPLAIAYVIRPTAIVPIAMLSIYVLLIDRRWFVKYVGWSLLVAVPWIAYNLTIYGWILSPYYVGEAFSQQTQFAEGLLGNLFSPSRGLFVFSPVLLFALSGFVLSLRDPAQRALNITYGAIVVAHSIVIGAASMWWAGHSFGPRFMTDIVPFLVFLTAFNFRLPAAFGPRVQTAVSVAVMVLALTSAFIHAQGALHSETLAWNVIPE